MKHLKVKGWGFYNSIGSKVVEPEKEQARVLISTLSDDDWFSITLDGDIFKYYGKHSILGHTYLPLDSGRFEITLNDIYVYKVESPIKND